MKILGSDHPITLHPYQGRVSVYFNQTLVAQSDNALQLEEGRYPPVIYIPRSDIRIEHYARSAHQTHCPYKGEAHYFSLQADGERAENVVWTYEDPYPVVAQIRDHVAFYPDKVTFETHELQA